MEILELHHRTPWGTVEIQRGTVERAFEIPANAVRHDRVAYWFEVRAEGELLARLPLAGEFSVPVVNRVSLELRTMSGAPLDAARWKIQLLDTSTAPSDLIDVAQGVTGRDGRIAAELAATPDIVRAASFNGGIANFHVEAYAVRDGRAHYVVDGFFANYSESGQGAMAAGTSTRPDATFTAEASDPTYATEASCPRQSWRVPDPDSKDDGVVGTKWGYVAEVHSAYGMSSTYTYGQKAETAAEFAVQVNANPWRTSGSIGSSVHNVNDRNVTARVYPHTPNQYDSRMELLQVKFNIEWLHAQEYESISGTCMKYNKKYPTTWIPLTVRTHGVLLNSTPDDCAASCTVAPRLMTRVDPDKGVGTGVQRAEYFAASICIVVCLGAQSGYTNFSKIDMHMTSACRMWFVYYDGTIPPESAPKLFVDAGEHDDTKVGKLPRGCEPASSMF